VAFRSAAKRARTGPANPWTADASPVDAPQEQVLVVRPRPRRMAGIPEVQSTLGRRELTREERLVPVWLVGAHGGAGVSTIAGLLDRVGDAGVAWPIAVEGEQARVVLVARESWTGLSAARDALTEWVGGQVPVHLEGLLLVASLPGGAPKELRELAERVRSQANGAVWRLGWQRDWLLGQATMPRDKTLRQLQQQLFASNDTPKEGSRE
jgi:hypothetical protein